MSSPSAEWWLPPISQKNGECSVRRLLPLGLVNKVGVWYLIADGECGMQIYRVSRFDEVVVTNEVFDPPKNFDVAAYWDAQADVIEGKRSGVAAVLRCTHRSFLCCVTSSEGISLSLRRVT